MAGVADEKGLISHVLHERAKKLAEPPVSESSTGGTETLVFSIANETYGIESEYVREVVKTREITPLPHIPEFVLGIVNHHGIILSVIDIYRFFGIGNIPRGECQFIIFVRAGNLEFGIAASHVAEARVIETESEGALPETLKKISGYTKCITEDQIAVLDIERLCADKRIIIHEEV